MPGPYHHGNLRRAVLDATAAAVQESGPTGFSMRDVARRAGVSHAAPAYHFGDRTGLLTAFATEGFSRLAAELELVAADSGGDLVAIGAAYVGFADANRAHFEVMFRRDLLRAGDQGLLAAMTAATAPLRRGLEAGAAALGPTAAPLDLEAVAIGAWSQMHGLATLWVNGNLPASLGEPAALARRVARAVDEATLLQHGVSPAGDRAVDP